MKTPKSVSELDGKYKYILVDEYQDTNLAQYAIVRALSIDHPKPGCHRRFPISRFTGGAVQI